MATLPHTDRQFLDLLRSSPDIGKLAADGAREKTAARQKKLDAIAALEAKAAREYPALEKAVQSAIARVREAEHALKAANDRLNEAAAAKATASHIYTHERRLLEHALRSEVDAKLFDDFRSGLLDELDSARKGIEAGIIPVHNKALRKDESRPYTNIASVNRRLAAINRALEEGELLRLAADQSNMAEKLAAIRAALPKIEPAVIPTVSVTPHTT
jgi:signal transduction histidine kinase